MVTRNIFPRGIRTEQCRVHGGGGGCVHGAASNPFRFAKRFECLKMSPNFIYECFCPPDARDLHVYFPSVTKSVIPYENI